jgi:hypothetical protein
MNTKNNFNLLTIKTLVFRNNIFGFMDIKFKSEELMLPAKAKHKIILPLEEIKDYFSYSIADNELNSIIVYESKNVNNKTETYLHYLAINIREEADIIIDNYHPNNNQTNYVYAIYKQKRKINNKDKPNINFFNVKEYTRIHELVYPTELIVISTENEKIKYHGFVKNIKGQDAKYCTCIIEVEYKNYKGGKYNPYAICRKSTKGYVQDCGQFYDYDVMPLEYLLVFADKHEIKLSDRSDRFSIISNINKWKQKYR